MGMVMSTKDVFYKVNQGAPHAWGMTRRAARPVLPLCAAARLLMERQHPTLANPHEHVP